MQAVDIVNVLKIYRVEVFYIRAFLYLVELQPHLLVALGHIPLRYHVAEGVFPRRAV